MKCQDLLRTTLIDTSLSPGIEGIENPGFRVTLLDLSVRLGSRNRTVTVQGDMSDIE